MDISIRTGGALAGDEAFLVRFLVDAAADGSMPMFSSWGLPPLYRSGVRWALPDTHGTGNEDLDLPPDVFARGWGDCGNLTVWRLCELNSRIWRPMFARNGQLTGIRWRRPPARALVEWVGDDFHVLIRLPNGDTEDPSIKLGMPR